MIRRMRVTELAGPLLWGTVRIFRSFQLKRIWRKPHDFATLYIYRSQLSMYPLSLRNYSDLIFISTLIFDILHANRGINVGRGSPSPTRSSWSKSGLCTPVACNFKWPRCRARIRPPGIRRQWSKVNFNSSLPLDGNVVVIGPIEKTWLHQDTHEATWCEFHSEGSVCWLDIKFIYNFSRNYMAGFPGKNYHWNGKWYEYFFICKFSGSREFFSVHVWWFYFI